MMHTMLKVLHFLAMAVWVGYPLGMSGDIRRALAAGPPHTDLLVARTRRTARFTLASGLLTAATGLALVFELGGFGAVSMRVHIGLTLTLVIFVVSAVLTYPAWRRIAEVIGAKGDPAEAAKAYKRYAMATGIEHALKVAILVLMAWKSSV